MKSDGTASGSNHHPDASTVDPAHEGLADPSASRPEDGATSDLSALIALFESDNASTRSASSATIAIVGSIVTYIGITLFVIHKPESVGLQGEFPVFVMPFLPLPILLLAGYQIILTAGVMRRARSAMHLEAILAEHAGVKEDYDQKRIGSPASESLMNIHWIAKQDLGRIVLRGFTAILPYVGLYGTLLLYTVYVVAQIQRFASLGLRDPLFVYSAFGYVLYWCILSWSTIHVLRDKEEEAFTRSEIRHRSRDAAGIVTVALAAVSIILQFIDREDPVAPYLYFTFWSVVLLIASRICLLSGRRRAARPWFHSASAAVWVSCMIYWIVLVPNVPASTRSITDLSNALIHGAVPAWLIVDWALGAYRSSTPKRELPFLAALPVAYLAFSLVSQSLGLPATYRFLSPASFGFQGVAVSIAAVLTVYALACWASARWLGTSAPEGETWAAIHEGSLAKARTDEGTSDSPAVGRGDPSKQPLQVGHADTDDPAARSEGG